LTEATSNERPVEREAPDDAGMREKMKERVEKAGEGKPVTKHVPSPERGRSRDALRR
jgi:hypothetical protein